MLKAYQITVDKNFLSIKDGEEFGYYPPIYNTLPQYSRYLPEAGKERMQELLAYQSKRKEVPKERNKILCRYLGPKINKRFPQLAWKAFIEPNFDRSVYYALSNVGRYWNKFNPNLVTKNIQPERVEKLNQLVKDNLSHLAPFVTYMNLDPSEAKKHFGKGLWKHLADNSSYRNKVLCSAQSGPNINVEDLVDFRSGCIEQVFSGRRFSAMRHTAALEACRVSPTVGLTLSTGHTINDTLRMSETLGREVKFGVWSLKRWEEEHEECTRLVQRRAYSDEPFCAPERYMTAGYTFERICSPLEMKVEGDFMHHCIGSYATPAGFGTYLAFKVFKDKERYTLGIDKVKRHNYEEVKTPFIFDQMYGKCNRPAPQEAHDAAHNLVSLLNSRLK